MGVASSDAFSVDDVLVSGRFISCFAKEFDSFVATILYWWMLPLLAVTLGEPAWNQPQDAEDDDTAQLIPADVTASRCYCSSLLSRGRAIGTCAIRIIICGPSDQDSP